VPSPLLFGLLIGLAQLFATLLVFALGLHGSSEALPKAQMPESMIGFILLMVILGLAHRSAKKTTLARGGEFGFGAAAKMFGLVAAVGGLTTGLGQWLYLAVINPGLRTLQHAEIMKRMEPELAKLAAEDAAKVVQQIDHATSAAARGLVYGINTLFFALILGLAYALIFRAADRREAAGK
jgi:Protein of unknown function (DUF4199)